MLPWLGRVFICSVETLYVYLCQSCFCFKHTVRFMSMSPPCLHQQVSETVLREEREKQMALERELEALRQATRDRERDLDTLRSVLQCNQDVIEVSRHNPPGFGISFFLLFIIVLRSCISACNFRCTGCYSYGLHPI